MLLTLTERVAKVELLPSTLRAIFQLLGRRNELQERMLVSVSQLVRDSSSRREFPGVVAIQHTSGRFRAVSVSSSDSGLGREGLQKPPEYPVNP